MHPQREISEPCEEGLPAALIEAFSGIPTANISDCMSRMVGARGLTRYNRVGNLVGTAFTVRTRPGDNLYIYKALTMLAPGDVLVVDAGGDVSNAVVGELIKLYALSRGCAGFVIDGAVRDVGSFDSTPCYARGVSHRGPFKNGPGEINIPVSVGGMLVAPGDIVVGDEDGVVAVPWAVAADTLQAAVDCARREDDIRAQIDSGLPSQAWLESILRAGGLA